jgi:predicted nucleotidyltransferase
MLFFQNFIPFCKSLNSRAVTKMISDKLRETITLAQKYPAISRVGIFGSYARGEQTKDSDIDILYDYDITEDCDLDILDYGEELEQEFSKQKIDFHYVSYKGVENSGDNEIKTTILQEVIWVYENKTV